MWDIDGLDFHLYPESNQKKKAGRRQGPGRQIRCQLAAVARQEQTLSSNADRT